MPTLEEQLLENKKEEIQHELANSKLENLESAISISSFVAGVLAFFVVYVLPFIIYLVFFENLKIAPFIGIIWFYGGIYAVMGIYELLKALLIFLVHYFYGISKDDYTKAISTRSDIRRKKWDIQKQLNERDIRIQREIKEEQERKQRLIYKEKEYAFIEKLNNAVYAIQVKRMSYDDATILYKKLLDEYATIKFLYYHSSVYYRNRFIKITSALTRYDSANPITRTRTIKLAVNKTESVKNDEPITKPETPAIDKPIVKTVLPVTNEKPVVDAPKTVEPFSQTYKPIVQTLPPFSPTYKPVQKTEAPKTEKPTIKAEPSVIKENAGKTVETPMEELYSNTESLIKVQSAKQFNESLKIDYKKLYEKKQDIGSVGEIFAFEWEKRRLLRNGLSLDKLIHVSLTNDTLGYDIVSVNHDGTTRYIEVKTTTGSSDTSFFMSESEKTAMEKLDNYCIYRLYYFDIEKGVSAITVLDKKREFDKYFNFQPISYRVSPK